MKIENHKTNVKDLLKTRNLGNLSSTDTERILKDIERTSFSNNDGHSSDEFLMPSSFGKSNDTYSTKHFRSPDLQKVKLINLSYSQPSTPKTPFVRPLPCATPCLKNGKGNSFTRLGLTPMIKSNFGGIPSTPMLSGLLKATTPNLRCFPSTSFNFPDILELIDDDQKPIEMVEKEITKLKEVNLSDATVVDYMLDITHDYPVVIIPDPQQEELRMVEDENNRPIRKCRRAKPVIYDESKVYKEEMKRKAREQRQRRKELFKQKSSGTRRSLRASSRKAKYKY